tara:strand:+ start:1340 stop:1582 length:243 start_codon:yes stop_codon:yes gene_type:complete
MEDSQLKELIKRIDLEIDSNKAGSKAYRDAEQRKSFSNTYIENCYGTYDDQDDIDMVWINEDTEDHRSTFDEANYSNLDS